MARLVVLADKANGYCFATLRGHTPYPPEVLYSSAADKDIWASLQVGGRTAHMVLAYGMMSYQRLTPWLGQGQCCGDKAVWGSVRAHGPACR